MRTNLALAVFGVFGILFGATLAVSAAPVLSDSEKLAILWADYCDRTEDVRCQPSSTPTTTPSEPPSPTPTGTPAPPSPSPTSPASMTPTSPAPTGSPNPTTSARPSPTPSVSPSPTPSASPTPPSGGGSVHLEAQAWWSAEGLDVPRVVGHHIHVEALNFPTGIVNGVYQLRVKVTLHDHEGRTNWIRVSDGSGGYSQSQNFALGPCHDCSTEVTVPVDFSRFATGIREVRLSVNIPDEQPAKTGAQRMFNSTGWGVCVRACTPRDRSAGLAHVEARGWYDDTQVEHGYQNQRADSMTVRAGQTLDLDIQPGADGLPTVYHLVTVNPNMHAGEAGRVLLEGKGEYHGTLRLPTDLKAGDRVAIIGHDGKNGGVLVLRVVP